MPSSQPASSSRICRTPRGCFARIAPSRSIVPSLTTKRGICGGGPASASCGLSGGVWPSLIAALTASFHVDSASLAISALSDHAFFSASAASRNGFSAARSGCRAASIAGDLPALGRPISMAQITGGSVQPRHGDTHRALPMTLEITEITA